MGTTGIEYRDIEGIIEAYQNYDKPNFSIWAGPSLKVKFEEGNMDQGAGMLRSFLNQLQSVATTTVYSIRVYNEGVDNINNKTPYEGSFTFMLGDRTLQKNDQGVYIMANGNPAPAARNNSQEMVEMRERMQRLETELANEREKRHKAEMDNLRTDFNNRIAGLEKVDIPDKWLTIGEKLLEKPDAIEKVFNGVGSLIDKFYSKRERAETPPHTGAQYLNGTDHHEKKEQMNENAHKEAPGSDTEEELTPAEQILFDRMDSAIETIESKIGTEALVSALEKFAAMSPDELNVMLKMM